MSHRLNLANAAKSFFTFIFLILGVVLIESCGGDEVPLTGSIEGTLTNAIGGEPIADATVTLSGQVGDQLKTNSAGLFRFDDLPADDNYVVSAESPDFETNETRQLSVRPQQVANADLALTPVDPFDISVSQLDFGTASSAENFNIINKRNGELRYSITTSSQLLTVSPDNGSIAEQNTALIRVTIDREQLSVGDFTEQIVINTTNTLSGASETLNVLISVLNPSSAILKIDEGSLGYGTDVSTRELGISNDGEETLTWSASVSEPWISISSSSGSLDPTESQNLTINVNRAGLAEGTYSGQVNFTGNGGSATVTVTMEVLGSNAAAVLNLSLTEVDFGLDGTSRELVVSNSGEVDLQWTVTSMEAWLSTSSTSGTVTPAGSQSINILVNRTALAEGSYSGTLTFSGNGGDGSIAVSMQVPSQDPQLSLSATELSFGTSDDTRNLTVSNIGQQTLNWSLTENEDWLQVSSSSGSVTPGNSQDITVTVVRDGLADGTYNSTIAFLGDGGDASVNVIMEVTGQGAGNDQDEDGVPDDVDADDDGDGLIEIFTINDLDDIRNDLNASGVGRSGAPIGGFTGYELMKDLDFDSDGDYSDTSIKGGYTSGQGWIPIGSSSSNLFNTILEGNGFTISNLLLDRTTDFNGIFGYTGILSEIRNLSVAVKFLSGDRYSAGLVGFNQGDLINCSVSGSISGIGGGNVGLLVGRHGKGTVEKCFSTGTVAGQSNSIGGLIGSLGNVSADVWEVTNSYSKATVSGNSQVGGLIGSTYWGTGEITKCYATGNVTTTGQDAGGLIGELDYGSLSSSYALGNVVSTSFYIGGLVGENSRTITSCFSTGSVTGASNLGGFAGRVIGASSITSTNYWDTETSGIATSAGSPTGQTTVQLQGQTTAAGIFVTWSSDEWDFGTSSQYPALKDMPGGLNEQRN